MRFAAYMAVSLITFLKYSFGSILYHCIYVCMFRMLMFNFVTYVFLLLLCILIVTFMYSYYYVCCVLGILCHCVVCIVCV